MGYVFQPRITRPFLRFFRRAIAPQALLALTDKAVIFIEEDKASGAAYGWLITICPREIIAGIESQPNQEWRDVFVRLARNNLTAERKVMVEKEIAQAWETLWASQNQIETQKGSVNL